MNKFIYGTKTFESSKRLRNSLFCGIFFHTSLINRVAKLLLWKNNLKKSQNVSGSQEIIHHKWLWVPVLESGKSEVKFWLSYVMLCWWQYHGSSFSSTCKVRVMISGHRDCYNNLNECVVSTCHRVWHAQLFSCCENDLESLRHLFSTMFIHDLCEESRYFPHIGVVWALGLI